MNAWMKKNERRKRKVKRTKRKRAKFLSFSFLCSFIRLISRLHSFPLKINRIRAKEKEKWVFCVPFFLLSIQLNYNGMTTEERNESMNLAEWKRRRKKHTKRTQIPLLFLSFSFLSRSTSLQTKRKEKRNLVSFPFILPSWLLPSRLNRLTPRDRGWMKNEERKKEWTEVSEVKRKARSVPFFFLHPSFTPTAHSWLSRSP